MADEIDKMTHDIIGCSMKVHRTLGPGFLESVYERALIIELRKIGLPCSEQTPLPVMYEGEEVGDFIADIVVDGKIIIELKAVRLLNAVHEAQLVNYLAATGIDYGLLLNFGSEKLLFKRKLRVYQPRGEHRIEQQD